ncbi:MAG: Hint domain-containing protein [Pseudomonadota bacterium]
MGSGLFGAAMIAWAQSHIDGIPALQFQAVAEGLSWRWHGAAVPLVGPRAPLILGGALNQAELRARTRRAPADDLQAAEIGATGGTTAGTQTIIAGPEFGSAFVVSDGERAYSGLPVSPWGTEAPLLVFHDHLPPSATDLTILQANAELTKPRPEAARPALLCFTPGTLIDTEDGPTAIEDLGPGDRVLTKDSGAQEIAWMGHKKMTGARLFALPHQRPIRIRAGALGDDKPARDLCVSPDHRVLMKSDAAQALWGERETLVRAADLVGRPGIARDARLTETYYIHLMLDRHEILRADGLEVESFHPGVAGLRSLSPEMRDTLLDVRPDLGVDEHRYGGSTRRMLTPGEVDLMAYGAERGSSARRPVLR